jgi:hypothetical protein
MMTPSSDVKHDSAWDEADQLISILRAWGIDYLVGDGHQVSAVDMAQDHQTAVRLIRRLAQCEYPRVRDASISLFILHPEIVPAVLEAIETSETAIAEQIITLTLATLYLQRLWSLRLTIALGHEPSFPEQPFAHLWQARHLPPPWYHHGKWGLLALQEFEQGRTGLPLNFLHDWQNQVNHLMLQEEPQYRHPAVSGNRFFNEDEQQYKVEDSEMSMRPRVDKARIEDFLKNLGRNFRKAGRIYLVGGAALVHSGVRSGSTVDIDIEISGENEGEMIDVIQRLIQQMNINIEFASPRDFMPLPKDWLTQSRYVGRYGSVDVFYFDFYSIALSKVQRGSDLDINDVKLLLQQGIITLEGLDRAYQEVFSKLKGSSYRKKLNPQQFAERYAAVRSLL